MQPIYFPLFAPAAAGRTFSLRRGNPGVGGVQFTTIQLALLLAGANANRWISLINEQTLQLEEAPTNLQQIIATNADEFFAACSPAQGVIVAPAQLLANVDSVHIRRLAARLICVSHHPFDPLVPGLIKIGVRTIVCCGLYQYYSNKCSAASLAHIPNPFIIPDRDPGLAPPDFPRKQPRFVHLGALHPGKGFLEVATAWPRLVRLYPAAELHVIGSSGTYGLPESAGPVPADPDYAGLILEHIPMEDIAAGRVVFHGNLGQEKEQVLARCHIALQNPTGASEAFPASPLELMSYGLPVLGSADYGMYDCMRHFPELVVKGGPDIPARVQWLLASETRYRAMQHRALQTAEQFAARLPSTLSRWEQLFRAVETGAAMPRALKPAQRMDFRTAARLWQRRDGEPTWKAIRIRLSRAKQFFHRAFARNPE